MKRITLDRISRRAKAGNNEIYRDLQIRVFGLIFRVYYSTPLVGFDLALYLDSSWWKPLHETRFRSRRILSIDTGPLHCQIWRGYGNPPQESTGGSTHPVSPA